MDVVDAAPEEPALVDEVDVASIDVERKEKDARQSVRNATADFTSAER